MGEHRWQLGHKQCAAAIRALMRSRPEWERHRYEPYLEGLARHERGEERDEQFPNPLTATNMPIGLGRIAHRYRKLRRHRPPEIQANLPLEKFVRARR